jgi:2-polyprenyl-6-methoxyphenol hydroxylase-like FAD-dependent oxidoreductase
LAGDAAHVHSPVGGQGLNIGVQDAVNLGWKLAQVVSGTAPDSLLDSYQAERHPIGARVLKGTLAQTALSRGDARTKAARETVVELLAMDEPRKRYAGVWALPVLGVVAAPSRVDSARWTRRVGRRRHGPRPS